MAARYGCLPSAVDSLSFLELSAALKAIKEETMDRFRVAAFPVWLEHGKKGLRFGEFLKKLGLADRPTVKKSRKLGQGQLQALYKKAEAIRSRDLKKVEPHGTL